MAVEKWLDNLPENRLDCEEERTRPEQHGPSRVDRNGESGREHCGDDRPNVGHETQQHRENAPEHRIRDADEPQPSSDQSPEASVNCRLHQEIAAEAASGIVQPLGCSLEITSTSEPNEAVSKVFALQQKKNDENYNDTCCSQWLNKRANDRLYYLQRRRVGLVDLDRDRWLRLSPTQRRTAVAECLVVV